jgi:IclR family acetate operon transcriptional repressor
MTSVKRLQSVHNACRVIDAIASLQPVGVSELARRTGLDKSGVQRIVVTLAEAGWLHPAAAGPTRWELTSKPLELGRRTTAAGVLARAQPVIGELRDLTKETAMVATLEAGRLVVLDVAESRQVVRMSLTVGSELPLLGSAAGRAIAAHLPPDDARRLLGDADADEVAAQTAAVAAVRRRGYATNIGDVEEGINTVGAAVLDGGGFPLGALVIAAPSYRMDDEQVRSYGRLVSRAAAGLSTDDRSELKSVANSGS